jgi:hypothetical protein
MVALYNCLGGILTESAFIGIDNTEGPEGLTFSPCILTVVANASDPMGVNSSGTTRMSYLVNVCAVVTLSGIDTENAADVKLDCTKLMTIVMLILYNGYDITKYYF